MAAREEGAVLHLSPSDQEDQEDQGQEDEDQEDEEAAAARRAQRFARDPRVRVLGGRLRRALWFPEEVWSRFLQSPEQRRALGGFLESTGPASLVFGVAAAGRLSASPEVRGPCEGRWLRGSWAPALHESCGLVFWKRRRPVELAVQNDASL